MHRQILWMAIAFVVLAVVACGGAYFAADFYRDVLLSLFGSALSLAVGLAIVNIFLDKKSRKIAAGPLLRLITDPIAKYHNELCVDAGRGRFGIPGYNRVMSAYQDSQGNPQAFAPAERDALDSLISDNLPEILVVITEIDAKLSDLVSVLGWSYDADIIAAALTCKRNISLFRSLSTPSTDEERLQRIEMYIDIDNSSSHVVATLGRIYEQEVMVKA